MTCTQKIKEAKFSRSTGIPFKQIRLMAAAEVITHYNNPFIKLSHGTFLLVLGGEM